MAHLHPTARRVLAAGAVTVGAAGLELAVARSAGSLFLAADAAHLVAHLGIFLVLLLPTRGAHDAREDAAAATVLTLVLAIAVGIGVESAHALAVGRPPPDPAALLVAVAGLAANLTAAWLLADPARTRWSFRAAIAHELSDGMLTVAGLLGAAAMALFHVRWIDAALGLAIAVWLGVWAARLLVRRVRLGPPAWRTDRHAD